MREKIVWNKKEYFSRTASIIGDLGISKLSHSHVAIFGLGGVGGYAVEALARSGVGSLDIIDHDNVTPSNLNRQIIATTHTVGESKTKLWAKRIEDINPDILVREYTKFYLPGEFCQYDFQSWDFIVDAIDTVSSKIDLIIQAKKFNIPIISSMGCGNRLDPGKLVFTDIHKTSMDPLARVIRRELSKRDIRDVPVVYSTEAPIKPDSDLMRNDSTAKTHGRTPGSAIFVPASAGLMIASHVTKKLIEI